MPLMGNALTRAIGRAILGVTGWRVKGQPPNEKKLIAVIGPHTSNKDFIYVLGAMLSLGVRISVMIKKEAFFFPMNLLYNAIGAIPIDRSSANDVTTQLANKFHASEKLWLGIAPEGTRSKVGQFKKGYLRIARSAGVPIFITGFNASTKEVVLDRLWPTSDDIDSDNKAIENYIFENFSGVRPENE